MFNLNPGELLHCLITVDGTFIYRNTPEKKRDYRFVSGGFSERIGAEEIQGTFIIQQSYGNSFLGCTWYNLHQLPPEGRSTLLLLLPRLG